MQIDQTNQNFGAVIVKYRGQGFINKNWLKGMEKVQATYYPLKQGTKQENQYSRFLELKNWFNEQENNFAADIVIDEKEVSVVPTTRKKVKYIPTGRIEVHTSDKPRVDGYLQDSDYFKSRILEIELSPKSSKAPDKTGAKKELTAEGKEPKFKKSYFIKFDSRDKFQKFRNERIGSCVDNATRAADAIAANEMATFEYNPTMRKNFITNLLSGKH